MYLSQLRNLFVFVLISASIYSCLPPTKSNSETKTIDFNDATVQKLLTATTEHNIDTLYKYLNSPLTVHKILAINCLGNLRMKESAGKLHAFLNDNDLDIRSAAAYAVGQIGDSTSLQPLISSFRGEDTISINNIFNHNVLEAIGKIGGSREAELISGVSTYRTSDTLIVQGQAKSMYRFASRNILPNQLVQTAIKFLENRKYDPMTRLYAAHVLSRPKVLDLTAESDRLINILSASGDANIKMALINALGKVKTDESRNFLIGKSLSNDDWRLRVNAIKALQNHMENRVVVDTLRPLLKDQNLHISSTTADLMLKIFDYTRNPLLTEEARNATNWLVRAKLMQAQMKNTAIFFAAPKEALKDTVMQLIKASTNNFEKAELIKVLGHDPYQYLNIINYPATSSLEKIAKIEALNTVITHPSFIKAFKANYIKVKREILYYMSAQMKEGDSGLIAHTAPILAMPATEARILLRDSAMIEIAKSKLKNPEDIEAINELGKLNEYLYGVKYEAAKPSKRKPIDYTLLATLSDSTKVTMKTSKGNIEFVVFPKHAPQTVSTMIGLAQADYFDNKNFHRVVPNFVAQGGCPRGDGYGSLDFLINSELGQKYYDDAGYLLMASAGNHTESSQFCFMHSPAPHLDGNYTLFGKIIKGQDVADELQIGDKIIDVLVNK